MGLLTPSTSRQAALTEIVLGKCDIPADTDLQMDYDLMRR
jgi:hypothetical protein